MPPLPLTGERTLSDVPEENYWFRRHLAVYEWIAARVRGLRVAELACGEGYGADLLAGVAAEVVASTRTGGHEHARLRYQRPNLRFERTLVESFDEPCDAITFLQTIEHIHDPGRCWRGSRGWRGLLRLDPEPAHARAGGAEKSENPWHLREYTAAEYRELLAPHFESVELYGLYHAASCGSTRCGAEGGMGPRPRGPAADEAVLRPLRTGDRSLGLRVRAEADCDLDRALDFIAVCNS